MNLRKGVWGVVASFAIYTALYWYHVISAAMPLDAQFSYFAGSCSVICMAMGLLLSARPRAVETSFGGLDRMYRLHKHLGVAALLLFIAHYATVPGEPEGDNAAASVVSDEGSTAPPLESPVEEEDLPIDLFGTIAAVGFTLLIIITLNRKIPYHRWITTHRFMGLFFIVVSVHVFLVLYDGEEIAFFSPPGVVLALLLPRRDSGLCLQAVHLSKEKETSLHPNCGQQARARHRSGATPEGRNVSFRAWAIRLYHHRR